MPEPRRPFKVGNSLVVVIPPAIAKVLGARRGHAVYWHTTRKGEAILAVGPLRKLGRPEVHPIEEELEDALHEIELLRRRSAERDRGLYAEGYNLGYLDAQERLTKPSGRRSEKLRRRQLYRYTFPEAAKAQDASRKKAAARENQTEVVNLGGGVLADTSAAPEGVEPHS